MPSSKRPQTETEDGSTEKYDVPPDPADNTYKDEGQHVPKKGRQDKA